MITPDQLAELKDALPAIRESFEKREVFMKPTADGIYGVAILMAGEGIEGERTQHRIKRFLDLAPSLIERVEELEAEVKKLLPWDFTDVENLEADGWRLVEELPPDENGVIRKYYSKP